MSRKIEDLTPATQERFKKFKARLDLGGIPFVVVSTLRTGEEQAALYAQGRKDVDIVNQLRATAGLPPITGAGNTIITQCDGVVKKSNHQSGQAFDLTFADENGNPYWPTDPVRWFALGNMAEECGLDWGGRFQPLDRDGLGFDPDHFELV